MIKTTLTATTIQVESPYNREFVSQAKLIGGRWSAPFWVFDIRDADRVRDVLMDIYGEDGSVQDRVTIRMTLTSEHDKRGGPIVVHGREIASATGRDSGARLGRGIVLIEGKFDGGGSVKNWSTIVRTDATVLVRDVPRAAADRMLADPELNASIEPEAPVINRVELESERDRLIARLAEIDQLLAAG